MKWHVLKSLRDSIQQAQQTSTLALVPTAGKSSATGTARREQLTATSVLKVSNYKYLVEVVLDRLWEPRWGANETDRLVWMQLSGTPATSSDQLFPVRLLPGIWIIVELRFVRRRASASRLLVGLRTRWHFGLEPK